MKILSILAIIVAIYIWWTNKGNRTARGAAVLLCLFGIWGFNSSLNAQQKAASQKRAESSSLKAESKKDDKSISDDEKVDKLKVKNTCKAINQKIAQHQELQGFKLKPNGDQFTVVVPSTATSLSDNQQKSVYQSLLKLIYEYDNGTNQGTFVEFQDQMGNPIARSSYTGSGEVKLMK